MLRLPKKELLAVEFPNDALADTSKGMEMEARVEENWNCLAWPMKSWEIEAVPDTSRLADMEAPALKSPKAEWEAMERNSVMFPEKEAPPVKKAWPEWEAMDLNSVREPVKLAKAEKTF